MKKSEKIYNVKYGYKSTSTYRYVNGEREYETIWEREIHSDNIEYVMKIINGYRNNNWCGFFFDDINGIDLDAEYDNYRYKKNGWI